ncbi:AlwI family type II restriction endonuclease [Candidatus Omnitrophota bacterium]
MAKLTRTKELWHIPKRGSVHQTIYMVYLLSWKQFLMKSWSSGKQELAGTEMGKAGLTESGKAITHQSVRTLLANVPKYLGFVYIDDSSSPSKIMVTDIGYELIKHHGIDKVEKYKKLAEYAANGALIETSDIFKKQMSKLIITNPMIRKDCKNVLVFPFRMTLRLLLELDYLDKEEIGYILFQTKSEDQLPAAKERIKNFRSLTPAQRFSEISAYESTNEGKLTLVKAPTAGYYMYLCCSTGLCDRFHVEVNKTRKKSLTAIKLRDKKEASRLIEQFKDVDIYDFRDDMTLWMEYFSRPQRIYPPFDVVIRNKGDEEILVMIIKGDYIISSESLVGKTTSFSSPFFPDEPYKIVALDLSTGKAVYEQEVSFAKGQTDFAIDVKTHKHIPKLTKDAAVKKIEEMLSDKYDGFDKDYARKLKTILDVVGKNYFDNRRKGGRFENLFFELLSLLKDEGTIDEVFWYGKNGKYGISEPAPGGKEGYPDVVFEIDNYAFVLELTTFRGIRAQWNSSEASSVPDHIAKYKRMNPSKKVVGIFCAPSIHRQLEQNLKLNARKEKVGMLFKPSLEFSKFLCDVKRKNLLGVLLKEVEEQLGHKIL